MFLFFLFSPPPSHVRRERNREHAKRSRVRKKFLLDSLQRSVDALQVRTDGWGGGWLTFVLARAMLPLYRIDTC